MLLTITLSRPPATDLGYLLHKHPARVQSFSLSFGQAHVFYPEAGEERCTAALLVDVFRSAMAGPSNGRLELIEEVLPLEATLAASPCRGGGPVRGALSQMAVFNRTDGV